MYLLSTNAQNHAIYSIGIFLILKSGLALIISHNLIKSNLFITFSTEVKQDVFSAEFDFK